MTFGDVPRPRVRMGVSPRARGRRGGRLHNGRAASDRRAGVDDVGKLDAEEDALRDVSGSAPDAFGAAARSASRIAISSARKAFCTPAKVNARHAASLGYSIRDFVKSLVSGAVLGSG